MNKMSPNPKIKKLSTLIKKTAAKLETMLEQFEKLIAKEKSKKPKLVKPKVKKAKVSKKAKK